MIQNIAFGLLAFFIGILMGAAGYAIIMPQQPCGRFYVELLDEKPNLESIIEDPDKKHE